MSTTVNLYTISFQCGENQTSYSVLNFLNDIGAMLNTKAQERQLIRDIDGKILRCFPYYYSMSRQTVVIPFGKIKQKNKPYWVNDISNRLEEFPADLFDLNSLAFDSVSDIMLFTTNRDGPTAENIQDYLNTFVPRDFGQSVKITPIFINTGLEKIKNAQLVRSVTINLDLGRPLNNFYVQQIENHQPSTLTAALQSIATSAKQDGDSKMLSLVLGLGHGKKDATLELESMLQLLEQINIESDFVKEIIVTYKNGIQDKVDTAKLKNSSILLSYRFSISGSQIAPEYMLNNLVDAVETKRVQFRPVLREYFRNRIETTAQNFEIIEDWRPD